MTRRLVGVGAVGVRRAAVVAGDTRRRRRESLDLAGHPAEPGGSAAQLSEPVERARAAREHRRDAEARAHRLRPGGRWSACRSASSPAPGASSKPPAAPIALFGRNLPVAALIPLTILWFGIDETQKVMFIFIACVPFVYSDASRAIARVPDRYVETAQTLGATPWQIVRKVLVALALPDIYNSLRHLFGLAFGYIMLAELINAKHGLGYLLMTSQRRGLSEHIILILIIIGLLAYGIDRLLFLFQRGLFPYRVVEE